MFLGAGWAGPGLWTDEKRRSRKADRGRMGEEIPRPIGQGDDPDVPAEEGPGLKILRGGPGLRCPDPESAQDDTRGGAASDVGCVRMDTLQSRILGAFLPRANPRCHSVR